MPLIFSSPSQQCRSFIYRHESLELISRRSSCPPPRKQSPAPGPSRPALRAPPPCPPPLPRPATPPCRRLPPTARTRPPLPLLLRPPGEWSRSTPPRPGRPRRRWPWRSGRPAAEEAELPHLPPSRRHRPSASGGATTEMTTRPPRSRPSRRSTPPWPGRPTWPSRLCWPPCPAEAPPPDQRRPPR